MLRFGLCIIVSGWIAWRSVLTPGVAFELMFQAAVPAEISAVKVGGYFVRQPTPGPGAGDMIVFLRFDADEVAFANLLRSRPFTRDENTEAQWLGGEEAGGSPELIWQLSFSSGLITDFGVGTWFAEPATEAVEVYQWRDDDTAEVVRLLFDVQSKRVYSLYTFG